MFSNMLLVPENVPVWNKDEGQNNIMPLALLVRKGFLNIAWFPVSYLLAFKGLNLGVVSCVEKLMNQNDND